MKRKWIGAVLAASMLATTAGCGGGTTQQIDVGSGEIPTELTIFSSLGAHASKAGATDANDLLPIQLMEELTGCHVTWTHPSSGAAQEKFNLLIASGNLPDAIVYSWDQVPGGAKMYCEDEVILPLNDLIENNMPNLVAFNKERPEVKKQYTSDDGEIYYIPFVRADKELKVFLGPQIREDWLKKLNLEVPTTTDELYEVLKAFKTQDPNGNGIADEIPMTGVTFENTANGIGNLLWAFGTTYDFYVKDGKVVYGPMEDRFEEGIAYINKLYSEELIDVDFLLNDRSKMDAKVMNDKSGFVYSYQPTLYYTNMNDGERKVTGIAHLTGPHGDKTCFEPNYGNDITSNSIAITTANKNPSGTMKWLDNFFGGKGLEYMNFGEEGKTFNWEDGYPKLTDYVLNNEDGTDRISMCAMNLGAYESWFPTLQDWRYYEQTLCEWGSDAISTWAESADTSGILPTMQFTQEEDEQKTQIMSQIDTFVSEGINKIVIGSEPLEYLTIIREEITKMGIDKVLDIYNAAYDRYNKK